MNQILSKLVEAKGSDLHLTAGLPPTIRVDGSLRPLEGFEVLTPSKVRDLVYEILSQKVRERFENNLELDTSHVVPGVGRFRLNVFQQRDAVGAVFRAIPFEIVSLDDLGLPPTVRQFADLPRGLVLCTGPTGSGKSTTLAALIDIINATKPLHIMSVEDPIEYLHHHKTAVVNQREVGEDTKGFAEALKHVLRQDPDVILIGEMRDLETISTALTAAETGHLVFATLHTQDAPQSIDRMIDVFPAHQQQQIRTQLATTLQGVVTQQLLPRAGGQRPGRGLRGPGGHAGGAQPYPGRQDPPDIQRHAGGREVRHAVDGPGPGPAGEKARHRHGTWPKSAAPTPKTCAAWSSRRNAARPAHGASSTPLKG